MINNETTSNVKLTLEQLQQIDVVEQKLAGLNTQVNVANKNLKVITNDTNRFAREIEAQKPVLESLNNQVEDKKKEIQTLREDIVEKNAMLNQILTEYKEHTEKMALEKRDLEERESQIVAKEKQLSEQGSALGKERILLDNDKADFNSKVAKLKEVISTL